MSTCTGAQKNSTEATLAQGCWLRQLHAQEQHAQVIWMGKFSSSARLRVIHFQKAFRPIARDRNKTSLNLIATSKERAVLECD
jgi:hypothetical protein